MLILREMLQICLIKSSTLTKARAILSCIGKLTVSYLGCDSDSAVWTLWLLSGSLWQYTYSNSNYTTTVSFHILSNSLFTETKLYEAT